jgi:tetratricopeptide (TPR) repeat protein
MTSDEFVEALLSAPDAPARHALMDESCQFLELETVRVLKERADRQEHDDPRQTLNIGLVAEEVAGRLTTQNDEARALALWAQANGHNRLAELEPAVRCYERAADLFKAGDKPLEAARTNIGQMGSLVKMGQFGQAQALAVSARAVFVEKGDLHYQAITDMNLGISHYLQGQYLPALEDLRKATEVFQALGDTLYVAISQINQANALQYLDVFLMVEQLHEQARPVFEAAGLRTAVAFGDVNLALLQYSRGDYTQAFQTFEHARDIFTGLADQGDLAQTDREESDLYLSLNLPDEALRLSERAERVFAAIGMTFELACARANHAVALARLGQGERATLLLEQARAMFVSQGNQTWVAHTDLQRAEIVAQHGQGRLAIHLATEAAAEYEKLGMTTKQVYAHIIAANAWADELAWPQALDELKTARHILGTLAIPWLEQRIDTCLGRVHEGLGERVRAIEHYQRAAGRIEQIAATLTAEEHRTAYVTDKLAPYEALVALYGAENPELAFQWAEQAKSRALVDMLAAGIRPRLHFGDGADAKRLERLQVIRAELNWLYTRVARGVAPGETGAPAAGPDTWRKIQENEREATSLWRDLQGRHAEQLSLISVAPLTPADLQANLPEGTALLEYFIARGQVIAFVITRDKMYAYPVVASLTDLYPLFENLAFQFSKFQYGKIGRAHV